MTIEIILWVAAVAMILVVAEVAGELARVYRSPGDGEDD